MNLYQQRGSIESRLRTLTNPVLKEILGNFSLAKTGVKATLQTRLLQFLEDAIHNNRVQQYQDLAYMINNQGQRPAAASSASTGRPSTTLSPAPNGMTSGYAGRPTLPALNGGRGFGSAARLSFKPSAFYHVEESLTPLIDLPEMPSNRHTVTSAVSLSSVVVNSLKSDPSLRVMLYCATPTLVSNYQRSDVDVAFPNQLEVKMNQEEVRSNYKGLKNKPGTTKPADLTPFVRKQSGYANNLSVTYALTTKKFSFIVNLVRKSSSEELTERIKNGKVITKERVLQEMIRKAEDPDIVAMSSVMSLKDPVSTMRMTLPCRSTVCNHNQCFDASYFIQLQEQAPTWTCPVCNKSISYDALVIDQYVQDILHRTSSSVEQVTIEPAGEWHEVKQGDDNNRGKGQSRAPYDNDSDDDIVEIPDTRANKIKSEPQASTPGFAQQTPPLSSREPSISNASVSRANHAPSTTGKRQSAVIDLTLSDDDEPPRPAKRQYTAQNSSYDTPGSMPDYRNPSYQSMPAPTFGQSGFNRPQLPAPNVPNAQNGMMNGMSNGGSRQTWPSPRPYSTFSPYDGSNRSYNGSHSPS